MRSLFRFVKILFVAGIMLGFLLAATYYYQLSQRPALTNIQQPLWQGIHYQRIIRGQPRKMVIHKVEIDLEKEGIRFFVTPPGKPDQYDINAQTTSDFLTRNKLQLAINGSFFNPFHSKGPLNYYPHEGDPVDVMGIAISSSQTYSSDYADWAVFCTTGKQVEMGKQGCQPNTQQAIAGKELLIKEGKNNTQSLTSHYATSPQPRTAIAINKEKNKVWFFVIDGRQKGYSEGITLNELAELMIAQGAYQAINMDGGGSSSLVTEKNGEAILLNAARHTRIPMRERPVGNHLGVFALPL